MDVKLKKIKKCYRMKTWDGFLWIRNGQTFFYKGYIFLVCKNQNYLWIVVDCKTGYQVSAPFLNEGKHETIKLTIKRIKLFWKYYKEITKKKKTLNK